MTQQPNPREEEIERFKTRFEQDLSRFMHNRSETLGQIKDWKIEYIHLKNTTHQHQIQFRNGDERCGFILHAVPKDLTADEAFSLRQHINEESASRGFNPYTPRKVHDAKELEKVVKRDPEAVGNWVEAKKHKWLNYAKKAISACGGNTNALPEDVVGDALVNFLKTPQPHKKPSMEMGRRIMWATQDACQRRRWRRQSDSTLVDKTLGEYRDKHHIIGRADELSQDKLYALLTETKKRLSSQQIQIIDIIWENHLQQLAKSGNDQTYEMLTLQKMGEKLALKEECTSFSREYMRQLIHGASARPHTGITEKIKKTAQIMSENDLEMAGVAEYLINLINHGASIKRGPVI